MDMYSDMAASVNWGSFEWGLFRAPLRGFWADIIKAGFSSTKLHGAFGFILSYGLLVWAPIIRSSYKPIGHYTRPTHRSDSFTSETPIHMRENPCTKILYIYIQICASMYTYVCIYIYIVYVYVYVYVYVHVYVYVYVYGYTYIYICMYAHTHLRIRLSLIREVENPQEDQRREVSPTFPSKLVLAGIDTPLGW